MAIRIVYDDREIGCENQDIGSIHFEQEIKDEATGYDVIRAIVKVMQIAIGTDIVPAAKLSII